MALGIPSTVWIWISLAGAVVLFGAWAACTVLGERGDALDVREIDRAPVVTIPMFSGIGGSSWLPVRSTRPSLELVPEAGDPRPSAAVQPVRKSA